MAYDYDIVHALYKKLLTFYPRGFRERLGEPVEQTFHDLYRERQPDPGLLGSVLWIFAETGVGIPKEHILLIA